MVSRAEVNVKAHGHDKGMRRRTHLGLRHNANIINSLVQIQLHAREKNGADAYHQSKRRKLLNSVLGEDMSNSQFPLEMVV